jgi:hypothetical protein
VGASLASYQQEGGYPDWSVSKGGDGRADVRVYRDGDTIEVVKRRRSDIVVV